MHITKVASEKYLTIVTRVKRSQANEQKLPGFPVLHNVLNNTVVTASLAAARKTHRNIDTPLVMPISNAIHTVYTNKLSNSHHSHTVTANANTGFTQTCQHCFPGPSRTQNNKIPGFSRTKKYRVF